MDKQPTGRIRERYNSKGEVAFYQVILYLGRDYKNKKKEIFLRADTREEAEDLLQKSLAEFVLGTFVPPSQMTLENFIYEEYLPKYCKPHVKATTYKDYIMTSKYICKVLGKYKLHVVTTTMIQEFINDLVVKSSLSERPLSHRTIVDIRRDLSIFMRKAVELKYITSNPVDGTKIPRPRKNLDEEKTVILSREEVQKLLKYVKGTPQECWYSLIIDGTLRRGEALGLTWDDVDFENSIIKIRKNWVEGYEKLELTTPKSYSSIRAIKLTEKTMKLLRREKARYKECKFKTPDFENSNRVIFMDNGKPWLPKSFYRKFKRTLSDAGLPDISLHALRHTGISLQIEAGANVKAVSTRAGHSDTQITSNIYTHTTKAMEQATVDIMSAILDKAVNI
ncbi:MAG: site-specific integrase [Lachnospiraceae bacterium]|nr:site-specific integrase [Lachnospiraceae bacterium]